MKTDHNTTGFAQWFFFKISNTKKGQVFLFIKQDIQIQHNEYAEA